MICTRCGTEDVERLTPRALRHARDYQTVKSAGFQLIGKDGRAVGVWVPRFSCDCAYRFRLQLVADEWLALVDHPFARREERRRAGLERYLHQP